MSMPYHDPTPPPEKKTWCRRGLTTTKKHTRTLLRPSMWTPRPRLLPVVLLWRSD